MDDVLLNKAATIERCLRRVHEEYDGHEAELATNYTRQDAIILNIERACQACIDMGLRVVRLKQLGIPQSSREVFVLLENSALIDRDLSQKLQAMVGFRNIAIHDYANLNLEIVQAIIQQHLPDLKVFSQQILQNCS